MKINRRLGFTEWRFVLFGKAPEAADPIPFGDIKISVADFSFANFA